MLKKIQITIICMLTYLTSFAQTYTVTRQDLGLTGSLDVIMTQAITDANSGGNVTILFDAPGLVQVDNWLPLLDIVDGSITFDKKIGGLYSHLIQGTEFAAAPSSTAVRTCFEVSGNANNSSISFKNLKVIGFVDYEDPLNYVNREAFGLYAAKNILIDHCNLESNSRDIFMWLDVDNIEISNNIIIGPSSSNSNSIYYDDYNTLTPSSALLINIHDNVITSLSSSQDGGIIIYLSQPINGQIKVENNTINNFYYGLTISPGTGAVIDPLTEIILKGNTFENRFVDINLSNPLPYWKVEDNTFNSNFIHINLSSYENLPNIFGINFIEPNTIDPNLNNQGNEFGPNGVLSFAITGDFGVGNKLIGLDLSHRVQIENSKYTIVRQTKIREEHFYPLLVISGANGNITPPNLTNLNVSGTNLTIDYELYALDPDVGDYAVDFYTTGPNGGLLDYLGSQTQAGNGSYTASITIPGGSLTYGDWVMATVTSLATHPGSVSIGTSEAVHEKIKCPGCEAVKFCYPEQICAEIPATFENTSSYNCGSPATYLWDFGDGTPQTSDPVHTFSSIGSYFVKLILPASSTNCYKREIAAYVTVTDDCILPCQDCITSFAPIPGQQYVISAWVQQANSESSVTYETPSISLEFTNNGTLGPFVAKGEIIDGWQRIDETFTVPGGATDVYVKLTNGGVDNTVYFDDIRIHPLKASLKSFVYDAVSMRLMAELDENNYATFYEYDEEGKLIRIKKETERGVKTIKESVNSTHKTVQ